MSKLKSVAESLGSSPGKAKDPIMLGVELEESHPPTGKKFTSRSEMPTLPPHAEPAFHQFAVDDLSAGNHKYVINRKERGLLGLFKDRDQIQAEPVKIEINPVAFHTACAETLFQFIENALRKKGELNEAEANVQANVIGSMLADGCSVMAYLKVRNILISEFQDSYDESNLNRPRVAHDHVIPLPYAYAIQQLGIVHAVDLIQEVKFAPVFPKEGHQFGIPTGRTWNSNAYDEAVSFAKTLGMQFGIVDLKEKKGTAWWLLQPYISEDVFELRCLLPETNYSSALALTYALFTPKDASKNTRVVFDLSILGTEVYGTMMRSPHVGINLTAFYGVSGTALKPKCGHTLS